MNKKTLVFATLAALMLGSVQARDLVSLAPKGAIGGFSVGDFSKYSYLKGLQKDWKDSGIEPLIQSQMPKVGFSIKELSGLFSGGMFLAVYPDGFFLITEPNAQSLKSVKKSEQVDQKYTNGWSVSTSKETYFGFSNSLAFIATPKIAKRFLMNERGLQAKSAGDFALWVTSPRSELAKLDIPPISKKGLLSLKEFRYAVKLNTGGFQDESHLELFPTAEKSVSSIFLAKKPAMDIGELPFGYDVSASSVDFATSGTYLTTLLKEFGIPINLDLDAFGEQLAVVTVKGPPTAIDGRSDDILGHSLYFFNTSDAATAEANLLGLMQAYASFSTAEGEGGFKVLPSVKNFKAVQLGLSGKLYYRFIGKQLALATSTYALDAFTAPKWNTTAVYKSYKAQIPANAVSYSFGESGPAFLDTIPSIQSTLETTYQSQGFEKAFAKEFALRYAKFLDKIGRKLGPTLSYSVVKGNTLVSKSFHQIKW